MICPECAHPVSIVSDSRHASAIDGIRRRRRCSSCFARWTTYEVPSALLGIECANLRGGGEIIFAKAKRMFPKTRLPDLIAQGLRTMISAKERELEIIRLGEQELNKRERARMPNAELSSA